MRPFLYPIFTPCKKRRASYRGRMLRSVFIKVSQLFAIIYALVFFFKFIKDSYLLIESHTTAH